VKATTQDKSFVYSGNCIQALFLRTDSILVPQLDRFSRYRAYDSAMPSMTIGPTGRRASLT
jgi:hypothetical protein